MLFSLALNPCHEPLDVYQAGSQACGVNPSLAAISDNGFSSVDNVSPRFCVQHGLPFSIYGLPTTFLHRHYPALAVDYDPVEYPPLPCLRLIHAVPRMNAKLGSDGRLTLSGRPLNQLNSPSFTWRTQNLLLCGEDTKAGLVCQGDFIAINFW
jgi:hypothetical protein